MVRCRPCQVEHRRRLQWNHLRSDANRWHSGRLEAIRRGISWHLTLDVLRQLQTRPCIYCGNALNLSGAGLDRIDGELPYTIDNVVPSCWPCNFLRHRGAFTFEEMKRIGPVLGPIWQVHGPRGNARQTSYVSLPASVR